MKKIQSRILYYSVSKLPFKTLSTVSPKKKVEDSYKVLNLPLYAKQDVVREAFLQLAKRYHPDSGSAHADIEKFVVIENAFRIISKHNTGASCSEDIETIVHNIRHTAPQHRQYLNFDGVGCGTPFQRQKQWTQVRAQKAANNVMEHRISKAVASEKTLMKKGQYKKHDIKTKYGFDRLVEDYIQESMSKGEFDNLSGKGKPLKEQNTNPYVDFTTHKLNEVLINNGFTPEWITMNKEIDKDIELLKQDIRNERMPLGPYPLNEDDHRKWLRIYEENKLLAKSVNNKIDKYNLIVPLMNKQKFHVDFDNICEDILKNGVHSTYSQPTHIENEKQIVKDIHTNEDLLGVFFKAFSEVFSFEKKKSVDT